MRRRDRPLDIFRQMRVVRSPTEMLQGEDAPAAPNKRASSTPSPDKPVVPVTKKKLNIPVGDVLVDPEYDTFFPANYTVPSGYVRYIVKLSDDVDLISDYCCDADDEEWIISKTSSDDQYGYAEYLNLDVLEKVINTLEKLTGHGDTVTLNNAEKAMHQVVPNIPQMVYSRLIPEIYHYWQSKRKKYNKPCCRKYWPLTSVTDTNPHMVFRPREKERYRLRKHRKNDLDSYRKLQQLRREFTTAQNLLQLVIEREKLKKADLAVQTEIIAQNVYEIQNPGTSAPRLDPSKQFSYELQYPHLLKTEPPPTARKKDISEQRMKAARGDGEVVERQKPGRKPGAELKRKRASLEAAAAAMETANASVDGAVDIVVTDETAPAQFANALLTGQALYEANTARLNTLGVPGPPAFLQPIWPSFMDDLPTREKLPIRTSIAEYAEELELRQDRPLPSKFRCRGRIGRGGRVIMDRVPIYDDEPNDNGRPKHYNQDITYIYPTSLPSLHEQARFAQAVRDCKDSKRSIVSADDIYAAVLSDPNQLAQHHTYHGKQSSIAGGAGLRNTAAPFIASNKNMELYQSRCHPIRDLGLAFPFPRLVQPAELSRREHEIYRMPDSDDESVDLPDGYVSGPSFPLPGSTGENGILSISSNTIAGGGSGGSSSSVSKPANYSIHV